MEKNFLEKRISQKKGISSKRMHCENISAFTLSQRYTLTLSQRNAPTLSQRDALCKNQFNFLETNFSEIIFQFPTDEFPGNPYNASYD